MSDRLLDNNYQAQYSDYNENQKSRTTKWEHTDRVNYIMLKGLCESESDEPQTEWFQKFKNSWFLTPFLF